MRPCYTCGREWGTGVTCQFCGQVQGLPPGVQIASAGRRLCGYLLEGVLAVFTLVIGWLIWALIVFKNGQTPAKQLLGMRVVKLQDNTKATWGTMFLREFIVRPVLSWVTLGIASLWLLWDANNQELWDKALGTIVVKDPTGVLVTGGASSAQQAPPPPSLPPSSPALPADSGQRPAPVPTADGGLPATTKPAIRTAAKRAPAKKTATKRTAPAKTTATTRGVKKTATKKTAVSAAPAAKKATVRKAVAAPATAAKAIPAAKKSTAGKKTSSPATGRARAKKG